MVEEESIKKPDDKTGIILVIIVLVAVVIILAAALSNVAEEQTSASTIVQPSYTTTFTNIDVQEAKNLIESEQNLIVADIRSCDCDYNKGHLPHAVWQTSPSSLYGTTSDVIVYCQDGLESISFCQDLLDNTYGGIYYLEGGFNAWKNAGYIVISSSSDQIMLE